MVTDRVGVGASLKVKTIGAKPRGLSAPCISVTLHVKYSPNKIPCSTNSERLWWVPCNLQELLFPPVLGHEKFRWPPPQSVFRKEGGKMGGGYPNLSDSHTKEQLTGKNSQNNILAPENVCPDPLSKNPCSPAKDFNHLTGISAAK